MDKAIYIGAGIDFKYIKLIDKYIKIIICVDGQPFSEFGKMSSYQNIPPYYNAYSRPKFLNKLLEQAQLYDFKLISNNDDKYIFKSSSQKVIYFINTAIPDDIDKIKDDISDFEHIIVMGHDPNSEFMKYTKKKIIFWGNKTTIYQDNYYDKFAKESNEDNNICYKLNYIKNYENKFKYFRKINSDGKIEEFEKWNDFLKIK